MAADKGAPGTDPRSFGLSPEDLRALGYRVGSGGESAPPPPGVPEKGPEPRALGRPTDPSWRWALATALPLLVVVWASSPRRVLPDPVPASAPAEAFSSARAMAQLVEIARAPRPVGSPEHGRVRGRLDQRLSALGLETEVHTTTAHERVAGERVRSATVRNVVARLPGAAPERAGAVLLTAPYDGAAATPAASSGAFGLAVIIEAVRALEAGPPLDADLVVALTDAGQLGALGEQAFAGHRWGRDVRSVVTVAAMGASGLAYAFESSPGPQSMLSGLSTLGRAGPSSLTRVLTTRAEELGGTVSAGGSEARRLTILALGDVPRAGQPRDTPEHVDERSLQHAGEQLMMAVRGMPGSTSVEPTVAFALPFVGSVHYPRAWSVWITVALGLLVALLVALLRYRGASWWGLAAGALAGVAPVVLAGWSASALIGAVTPLHAEHGWIQGAFWHADLHVGALAALGVAWVAAGQAIARRWVRRDVLAWGALLVPLALCVWLSVRAPAAAYTLQWPIALACLATAILALAGPTRTDGPVVWAVVLALSAVALSLIVPTLELLSATLTVQEAGALGLLFATTVALLVPTLDRLLRPRSWWLPGLSVGVAAALLVAATPSPGGSARHPELSTLVYLADEPASLLPGIAGELQVDADLASPRRMTGAWLTVPGSGEEWARSWVAEATPGARVPGPLFLPHEELYEVAGAGPNATLAPPIVEMAHDTIVEGRRTVRVRVHSGLGGEMMAVMLGEGVDAELTAIDGAPLTPEPRPVRAVTHWGTDPVASLYLDVSAGPEEAELPLVIVEHHLRPLELLGEGYFERPESILPNQALGSDRVVQRTDVVLPLTRTGPIDR